MPQSKIQICNVALANLGAAPIRSFDEDNKRSRMCDVFFNSLRDYILARQDWSFARAYAELGKIDPDVLDLPVGISAYAIPSDCLAPRDIAPPGSGNYWQVMGSHIWCKSSGHVFLYYTRRVPDTTNFSAPYASVLSIALAVRMAPAIAQNKKLTDSLFQQYNRELYEAWETDANIGNNYRAHDEDPNNDTFVYPDAASDLVHYPVDGSR